MGKRSKVEENLQFFRESIETSRSLIEVARAMGYKESGGVYQHFRLKIEEHGLDISHFTGQGWAKGETRDSNSAIDRVSGGLETPWNEVFCKNSKYKGGGRGLLGKLVRSGKRAYRCEVCGISEWNGQKLRLELDHIDGDNRNNEERNLRISCPNCHSQTETHSRRKT